MQIGCEALGSSEPAVDAESILLAARFFSRDQPHSGWW